MLSYTRPLWAGVLLSRLEAPGVERRKVKDIIDRRPLRTRAPRPRRRWPSWSST
jgi:hypothetical protein